MQTIPSIVINVEVDGQIEKRDLTKDLSVQDEHINEWLQKAPGIIAYWHTLYEKQKSIVDKHEVKLNRKRAEVEKEIRKQRKQDESKITNSEIQSEIITNESFQELEDKFFDLRETMHLLKAASEAVKSLNSTLYSLSSNMRYTGSIHGARAAGENMIRKYEESRNKS